MTYIGSNTRPCTHGIIFCLSGCNRCNRCKLELMTLWIKVTILLSYHLLIIITTYSRLYFWPTRKNCRPSLSQILKCLDVFFMWLTFCVTMKAWLQSQATEPSISTHRMSMSSKNAVRNLYLFYLVSSLQGCTSSNRIFLPLSCLLVIIYHCLSEFYCKDNKLSINVYANVGYSRADDQIDWKPRCKLY